MYVLPITLYEFQLQYFKEVLFYQLLKELGKMQRRVLLWITKAFQTLPTWEVEVIIGLISIQFHLDKINNHYHLHIVSLPKQHVINFFLDEYYSVKTALYCMAIEHSIHK